VPPSLVTTAPDGHLQFPAGTPVVINPNQGLTIPATIWNGDSFYDALQVNVIQRISHGLSFQAAYAWSKGIDNGSSEVNGADNGNTADNPYPFFPKYNRGFSDWDVPQHLALNFDWLAPSPQFRMAVPRFLLSGWELGGIYTVQSGQPFSVGIANDLANTGTHGRGGERPDYVAAPGCKPDAVNPGSVFTYINANCFAIPAAGELGNVGRNTLRSPGIQDFDFSVFKNHNLFNERLKVQFRAEFFNLFNWTSFRATSQTIFSGRKKLALDPNALSVDQSHTAFDEREIQFGLKFIY
jgi:hypothetical protein